MGALTRNRSGPHVFTFEVPALTSLAARDYAFHRGENSVNPDEAVIEDGDYSGYNAQLERSFPVNNRRAARITVSYPPVQFKRSYVILDGRVFKTRLSLFEPEALEQLSPEESEYILRIRRLFPKVPC